MQTQQNENRKLNFNQPMPTLEEKIQAIEIKKEEQTLANFDEFNIEINGVEPAKIKTNLETIKTKLILQRDNLKIEVSEDSKVAAGKFRASVNKLAKNIKLEVENNLLPITKPIDEINKDVKDISAICKEISTKIDLEIEKVNHEIRQNIIKFANEYLKQRYEFYKLGSEFQTINLSKIGDDLGHINSKNDDIKPSSKAEIERLVVQKKTLETNSINRLLILENECLKAGILPLSKDDVASFLMESDEIYNQKLQILIQKTKEREEKIKSQAIEREKAQLEAKKNAEIARIKAESDAKIEIERAKIEAANQLKINAELDAIKQQEQTKIDAENQAKKEQEITQKLDNIDTISDAVNIEAIKKLSNSHNENKIIEIKQKLFIDEDGGEYGEERNSLSIVVNNETLFSMRDGMCPEDAYFCRDLNDVYNVFPAIQKACQYLKDGFSIRFIKENYLTDEDENDILQNSEIASEIKTQEVAKPISQKQEIDNEFYTVSARFKIEKSRLEANRTSFEKWTETLKAKLSESFKTFDGIDFTNNESSLPSDIQDDLRFLAALRDAGVSNWNDYDIACDIYNGQN